MKVRIDKVGKDDAYYPSRLRYIGRTGEAGNITKYAGSPYVSAGVFFSGEKQRLFFYKVKITEVLDES